MRPETEIQKWLEVLVGKNGRPNGSGLYSVIRFGGSQLDVEMQTEVERYGGLSPTRHRAVHDACRVLRSLVEPRFRSANTNISNEDGTVLRADLVLEDEIGAAFVIVEIKRNSTTARQAVTELLAYAFSLCSQHPGSQVFLVVISTSWLPLERHAFAQLAEWRVPVLPLEYVDHESAPILLVRSDLLPDAGARRFSPKALLVETKVFYLPSNWRRQPVFLQWANRISHAISGLIREAEHSRASGFVIAWCVPGETDALPERRLYISVAVRNPCRPREVPVFKNEQAALDFAWTNNITDLYDDTATRLLLGFEIDTSLGKYSSESEGTWAQLQARLEAQHAEILRFDSFGDIGDQVSNWRTQQRYVLAPVVADIASLPQWHPLTWLPALESLIDMSEHDESDQLAWQAYRCGEDIGKFMKFNRWSKHRPQHFGRSASQARFARTWCDLARLTSDMVPNLPTHVNDGELWCHPGSVDCVTEYAYARFVKDGEVAGFCFTLGHQVQSGSNNVEYLVSRRHELREKGFRLPEKLDELVDRLQKCAQSRISTLSRA